MSDYQQLPFGVLFTARPDGAGGLDMQFLSQQAEELLEHSAAELSRLFSAGILPLIHTDVAEFYASAHESLTYRTPWRAEFAMRMPRSGTVR